MKQQIQKERLGNAVKEANERMLLDRLYAVFSPKQKVVISFHRHTKNREIYCTKITDNELFEIKQILGSGITLEIDSVFRASGICIRCIPVKFGCARICSNSPRHPHALSVGKIYKHKECLQTVEIVSKRGFSVSASDFGLEPVYEVRKRSAKGLLTLKDSNKTFLIEEKYLGSMFIEPVKLRKQKQISKQQKQAL